MVGFLHEFFNSHDVEIEWMSEILGKSYEQELVEDILSLMSSFSNKIYGRRSAMNKKARKIAKEIEEKQKIGKGNAENNPIDTI